MSPCQRQLLLSCDWLAMSVTLAPKWLMLLVANLLPGLFIASMHPMKSRLQDPTRTISLITHCYNVVDFIQNDFLLGFCFTEVILNDKIS